MECTLIVVNCSFEFYVKEMIPNQNQSLTKRLGSKAALLTAQNETLRNVSTLFACYSHNLGSNGTRIRYFVDAGPQLRKK